MPSRLDELRRHRALLQEHLAWLDREIAAAAGGSSPSMPEPRFRPPAPPPAPSAAAEADQLFAQFRAAEEKRAALPTKTGCWMAFILTLLLAGGILFGLAYFFYR